MKPTLLFGETRTRVRPRHALIAPDSHVPSSIPGIEGAVPIVVLSQAMGAGIEQLFVTFRKDGRAVFAAGTSQTFVYVLEGTVTAAAGGTPHALTSGGYAYAPAGTELRLDSPSEGARIAVFTKVYQPRPGVPAPAPVFGNEADVPTTPFLGDEAARLQLLLPDVPAFDMAMNIFNFEPGAHLPFVETHIMEHGFVMLQGMGVYRLDGDWCPITKGDAIWMAPYCPQWFVAMGKEKARYLYYKDINRPVVRA
jgi:(S)-ureidoglycine aminohydrolase